MIKCSSNKFAIPFMPESEWKDRLRIPSSKVKDDLLKNVDNKFDKEVLQTLIDEKVFPTVATSNDMRNNPYYSMEDKFISLISEDKEKRKYGIPYPGGGRYGTGKILLKFLNIFDNGQIQFENGKIRDIDSVSVSTLKSDFSR